MAHLYTDFNRVFSDYKPVHDSHAAFIELVRQTIEMGYQWSQTLSIDDAVWPLVAPRSLLHDVFPIFKELADQLNMIEVRGRSTGATRANEIFPLVMQARGIASLLKVLADQAIAPSFGAKDQPHCAHPMTITRLICILMPLLKDQSQIDKMADWPFALYHPEDTTQLVYHLVQHLRFANDTHDEDSSPEINQVILFTTRSSDFFELRFLVPTLRLTPVLWNIIAAGLRMREGDDEIEYLREMGGEIEPLTWNEGHGEGVIVRLPWVQSRE